MDYIGSISRRHAKVQTVLHFRPAVRGDFATRRRETIHNIFLFAVFAVDVLFSSFFFSFELFILIEWKSGDE